MLEGGHFFFEPERPAGFLKLPGQFFIGRTQMHDISQGIIELFRG